MLGLRLRPTVRQGQVHLAQPRDPPQPVYQREQIFVPIALAQDQLRVFYRTELATSTKFSTNLHEALDAECYLI